MDNIKVKISEKYKPPPKIALPLTYSLVSALSKQIEAKTPTYDFTVETNAIAMVQKLRKSKQRMIMAAKEKLYHACDKCGTNHMRNSCKSGEANLEFQLDTSCEGSVSNDTMLTGGPSQHFSTFHRLLTPTQYSSSNVPKERTILNSCKKENTAAAVPLNLSEFETDTSSPFDNMELETINDIEELAQVLKSTTDSSNEHKLATSRCNNNNVEYMWNALPTAISYLHTNSLPVRKDCTEKYGRSPPGNTTSQNNDITFANNIQL